MHARILHISDLHYCPKHLDWVEKAMAHAIGTAIHEGCTLAVISGDSFDHALEVHEPAVAAYVRRVVELATAMPVLVLQGTHSHDRPGSLDILKAIPARHPIIVADTPAQHEIGGCLVSCLPSINKADAHFDLPATMSGFAERNRASDLPRLLVAHGTVNGAVTESRFAMVSPDHEFSTEALASAEADAVLLGHIHAHQYWPDVMTPSGGRTTIAYAGSLAKLTHGHGSAVGFLMWDVSPGKANFQFAESPSRKLVHLEFDGPPDLAALRNAAKAVGPDDAVRIRWAIDEEHACAIDKVAIRALFEGAEVKLEGRVLPVQRVRAAGIGHAASLSDKLAHWARTTDSEHALDRLLAKLESLRGG